MPLPHPSSDQKCRIARIRENNRVSPQKKRKRKKQTNKRTNERMKKKRKKKRRKKERKIPWHEAGIGVHGNRGRTRRCVKPNIRIPDRIINHEFNQVYSVTRTRTRVADIISLLLRERTNVRTFSNRPVNYAFILPYILSAGFPPLDYCPTNLLPCKFHGF